MRVLFKITSPLVESVREDLVRPHEFAAERVGFLICGVGRLQPNGLIILAHDYHPVANDDYVDDPSVGALMGSEAIRKAMQLAYNSKVAMFHVHLHDHTGCPWPSSTDRREAAKFVPDFWHVRPEMPHGTVIVSRNSLSGRCWYPNHPSPISFSEARIVGPRLVWVRE